MLHSPSAGWWSSLSRKPALHLVLVERHLDGGVQPPFIVGFEDIPVGFGNFCPLEQGVSAYAVRKMTGMPYRCMDLSRCFDAVHGTGKVDIHEHEIGMGLCNFFKRSLPGLGRSRNTHIQG